MRLTSLRITERGQSGTFAKWVFGLTTALVLAVCAGAVAIAPHESGTAGLAGILPTKVPVGLSADAFGALDGNWEQWGKDVGKQVEAFYAKLPSDPAEQRAQIEALQRRLKVMNKALSDSRYRQIFDPLATLYGRLSRRVEMAEAILDVLEQDPEVSKRKRLESVSQSLAKSVESLRAYLNSLENGEGWVAYAKLSELKQIAETEKPAAVGISTLKGVLKDIQPDESQMTSEQTAFLNEPAFVEFREAIQSYLDAAAQQESPRTPADKENLRAEFKRLVTSLEGYEEENSEEQTAAARTAYSTLRKTRTCDLTPVTDALRLHYFNYNLRVTASETFLQRLVEQKREDNGPVDDFILGAKVDGQQWTSSEVGIDLKPSYDGVEFDITLRGVTQSRTNGVTDQATIYTSGYHQFWAAKQITFDGERFTTAPARIDVDANNTTTGASTRMNGVPLFGSIARGIAVKESQKRRPQSEAITVGRVSDRVLPEFNSEVDQQFSKANDDFGGKVVAALKDFGLYPTSSSIRTTDDALLLRTQLMDTSELAGGLPNPTVTSPTGIVIHVHESLINNSLDRTKLAGRTVTDQEMAAELEKALSRVLGRSFKFSDLSKEAEKTEEASGEDEGPATLMFAKSDPIRVKIDDGVMTLTIRTGLKQEEGKEDIPLQVITVPLEFRIEGDKIVASRGAVSVSPVENPPSRFKQIARAGVVRKKIQAALPERKSDRLLHLKREGQEPLEVAITSIKTQDGWLSLVIE